jgi:two-component system, OmpR family, torCAD operon response regulator TorR
MQNAPGQFGNPSILIVEDDPIVSAILSASLTQSGYTVRQAETGQAGRESFIANPSDLVLIDIRLPDGLGHAVAQDLKALGDPAVIFLTSLGHIEDRIRGLNMADDYLVKPVDLGELHARVGAVLRRFSRAMPHTTRDLHGWTLDLVRRELADPSGKVLRLTRGEFDIVAALVQAEGPVLSRDYLLEVSGSADSAANERSVDVLVSRIRGKFRQTSLENRILTVPGQGYRWRLDS